MTDTTSPSAVDADTIYLPVVTEHLVLGRDLVAWSKFDHITATATSIWIDGQWREMFGIWEHLDDVIAEFDIPTPTPNEPAAWVTELDKLGSGLGKQLLAKMNQIETFWVAIRFITDPQNSQEVEDDWTFFRAAEPVRVLMRSYVPASKVL